MLLVLNVALYVVLFDATIETFVAGSPSRWIVAAVVLAYFALTALIWKRTPIGYRIFASLLLLGAIVAYSGWRFGSLDAAGGIVVARHTAAFAAAAFVAAVLLLTVAVSLVDPRLPLWLRATITLVALYALLPIVLALGWGAGFGAALAGGTPLTAMPFWLRGPYLAVEIVLPALFLLGIVGAAMLLLHRKPGAATLFLTAAAALVAVQIGAYEAGARGLPTIVAFEHPPPQAAQAEAGCTPLPGIESVAPGASHATQLGAGSSAAAGLGELSGSEATAQPAQAVEAPCVTPTNVAPGLAPLAPTVAAGQDTVAQLLQAYVNLPNDTDRSPFDAHAEAAKIGAESSAAFNFVRDRIANEIYSGVLRGANSTLSAQSGNDLDKSVLLAALLTEQNHRVRYAQCDLPENLAHDRIREMFSQPAATESTDRSQEYQTALVRAGVPQQQSAAFIAGRQAARTALDQAAAQTAQTDLALVRNALTQSGIKAAASDKTPTLLDEAKTHYWIQLENDGRWEDLDPAFAAAKWGQRFCNPDKTYTSLPPEAYQYITFRVRNEYVAGTTSTSVIALEQRIATADLPGKAIIFTNIPAPIQVTQPRSIAAASSFAPFLTVGDTIFAGQEFPFAASAPSAAGKNFVSQSLEFELTTPRRTTLLSRSIVDITGTQTGDLGRAAFQLVQPYAIAVSTGRLDETQAIEAERSQIDPAAVARLLAGGIGASASDQELRDLGTTETGTMLVSATEFALASDRALTGQWAKAYPGVRAFRDQPLIVVVNPSLRQSGDKAAPELSIPELSIDVRNNAIRVASESPSLAEQALWLNAQDGLTDGALEQHLLPSLLSSKTGAAPDMLVTLSTSSLFSLAQAQGIAPLAMLGQGAIPVLTQQLAKSNGAVLAAAIRPNVAVVLPSRPVSFQDEQRLGAWTMDPQTGQIVALLDTGLHQGESSFEVAQAMTERETVESEATMYQRAWSQCLNKGYSSGLCKELYSHWQNRLEWLDRYWKAMPRDELATQVRFIYWSDTIQIAGEL
jgi:hypothetical protein